MQQKHLRRWKLTPNAENRFRLGHDSCLLRKTSDLGRGGFFGRIITRDSSLMSSSNSLLSDETDNCLCTGPWSDVDQSVDETRMKRSEINSCKCETRCSPTLRALASPKHAISIKIHCCCSSLSDRRFICWTHVYDFDWVDSQFRIFIWFWAIKIMNHKILLRTAKIFRKCAPSNVVQLEKGKKQRILWLNSNAAQFMQWKLSLTLSDYVCSTERAFIQNQFEVKNWLNSSRNIQIASLSTSAVDQWRTLPDSICCSLQP